MTTNTHGPFVVSTRPVRTGIIVGQNESIQIRSSGRVDFGGGFLGLLAPVLDADGDNHPTPSDYPAPALRKNSLIVGVRRSTGGTDFFQGGVNPRPFTTTSAGELILVCNDATPDDNTGGWSVTITHTFPDPVAPVASNLSIARIELVQSIQRADNSVPLIAGKRLFIRVYVNSGRRDGVDGNRVRTISGQVNVRLSDGRTVPALRISSPGMPATQDALPEGSHNRNSTADSLNFMLSVLPPEGSVQVTATVFVPGRENEPGYRAAATTNASLIRRPVQVIQPLLVDLPFHRLSAPPESDALRILRGAREQLPFADDSFRLKPFVRISSNVNLFWQPGWWSLLWFIGSPLAWIGGIDLTEIRVAFITFPRGQNTAGIAMYRPFIAFRTAITSFGSGVDVESCAHELGHAFGLNHAACGNPPIPLDSLLPNMIEEPGWNQAISAVVPAGTSEIMTYCRSRWPSVSAYQFIIFGRHV